MTFRFSGERHDIEFHAPLLAYPSGFAEGGA